jgi:hypothetical protein
MDNKYYTPDISDLFVGYECEFHGATVGGVVWLNVPEEEKDKYPDIEPHIPVWTKWIIGSCPWTTRSIQDTIEALERGQIRTPHLTKEQIEAEGWKESDTPEFFDRIGNDRWFINWEPKFNWIYIGDNESQYEYSGTCPSINEFRKICKWLGITT